MQLTPSVSSAMHTCHGSNGHCVPCMMCVNILEVGQLPGDVLAEYCITRHYLDPAVYYSKIWPDLGNLSQFLRLSTIPHAVKHKVVICLATVFDARHCGVMRDQ